MAKRTPRAETPEISTDNQIVMYLHCGLCIEDYKREAALMGSASPAQMARLNVGWTPRGIQVWCAKHDCNVVNVDFEGARHPAVTMRARGENERH